MVAVMEEHASSTTGWLPRDVSDFFQGDSTAAESDGSRQVQVLDVVEAAETDKELGSSATTPNYSRPKGTDSRASTPRSARKAEGQIDDYGNTIFICDFCDFRGTFPEMERHEQAAHS